MNNLIEIFKKFWKKNNDIDPVLQPINVWNLDNNTSNNNASKIEIIPNTKKNKFSMKLSSERKQQVAEKIIENSEIDKLYWIQMIIACMLATLWLLANSIPVIIWSMLVSPIMTPIQSFAFAITCWKRHLYVKSLKILLLTILIAVWSSFLICYFVPFASITEQVLLRGTPTVIDFVVALLSWIIAFVFLWYEKMEESIVWIAIAVSLMPPLASVWIWLHFLNFSVAQWSFLLFITNLFGILFVWILIFFLFGFKPTNKLWKKRTEITVLMVFVFICLISVPLWKSMTKIAETQMLTSSISKISNDYLDSLNEWIDVNSLSFRKMDNDVIRITTKLDVPSDFMFTNLHKDEFTKRLSAWLWESVELDLDIVEISSVYVDEKDNSENKIIKEVSDYLDKKDVLLVDYDILYDDFTYFFLNVYSYISIDKTELYNEINQNIKNKFWDKNKIVFQWQDNPELNTVKKNQAEIDLEKQFYALFPKAELWNLELKYTQILQDEETYIDQAELYLEFKSPYSPYQTNNVISEWKNVVKEYLWMDVVMKVKFESFYVSEI